MDILFQLLGTGAVSTIISVIVTRKTTIAVRHKTEAEANELISSAYHRLLKDVNEQLGIIQQKYGEVLITEQALRKMVEKQAKEINDLTEKLQELTTKNEELIKENQRLNVKLNS